jgi:hypothetical protein
MLRFSRFSGGLPGAPALLQPPLLAADLEGERPRAGAVPPRLGELPGSGASGRRPSGPCVWWWWWGEWEAAG